MRRETGPRPFRLPGSDQEIREEIQFYLEERAKELEAQGVPPDEARRRALDAFGDPEVVVERVRSEWSGNRGNRGGRMIGELVQDVRYTLRTLVRNPVFALAAGITLSLAIGANAAIFGIVDASLLAKPPVRDPESLVAVYTTCRAGDPRCASSYPDYLDYRAASSLHDLAGTGWISVSAARPGESPNLLNALAVTGNYFDVLGVPPALGRTLQPADDRPGATAAVVMLAHDTWRTAFGGDDAVVGSTLELNGVPYEIVGVAPQGFRGVALRGDPDLFLPITARERLGTSLSDGVPYWESRDSRWIEQLVGRLAPGATLAGLQQEMDALSAQLNREYPDRQGRRITADPSSHYSLPTFGREDFTRLVGILAAVSGLTLLLAAANVANLLLARAATRRKEIGVRLALGSSASRLVRQLLVESVTLALMGGAGGLLVASLMLRALAGFQLPGGVPLEHLGLGLDARVFAFSLGISLVTGVLFGVVPALRGSSRHMATGVRAAASVSSVERDRLRSALVTVQVCACLVLLTGAGLFLRGLRSGLTYDLGLREQGLALARFDLSLLRYAPDEAMGRVDEMLARVEALPGVTSASVSTFVPLQIGRQMGFFVEVDGYQPTPDEEMRVEMAFATEGFFRTLGTTVLAGRDVDAAMVAGDQPVVVLNQQMADAYWEGGRAPDGQVRWRDETLRVVGVTENAAWRFVPQPPLNFMVASLRQFPSFATNGTLTLAVRSEGDPEALLAPVRQALLAVEPRLTFQYVQTMEDVLGAQLSAQRMGALLLTLFGGLALVLSVVGIGGVVAYIVGRQKQEIGIRIALGASRAQVQLQAVLGMALPIAAGLALGLLLALRLGRSAQAFLVEASATTPWTYVVAAALLTVVTLLAAWVPARRASAVDPVRVLKAE